MIVHNHLDVCYWITSLTESMAELRYLIQMTQRGNRPSNYYAKQKIP